MRFFQKLLKLAYNKLNNKTIIFFIMINLKILKKQL